MRKWRPLELVALLRDPEMVVHDEVRADLAALLPHTELAAAAATLAEIEARYELVGMKALSRAPLNPPIGLVEPAAPRWPLRAADLRLAGFLGSPYTVPDPDVRRQLADHLARGPLGPAVWKVREIDWAVATPPIMARLPRGIDALDHWDAAGEVVDDLVALPHRHQAAAEEERFHHSLVVHQLLARMRIVRFQDAHRHLDLATLGATVAQAIPRRLGPGRDWRRCRGLVALALVSQANACRMVGHLPQASRLLTRAQPYIRGEPDPVIRWEYWLLVGAVLTFLSRAPDARRALDTAVATAYQMGDGHRLANALVLRTYLDCFEGSLCRESLSRMERAVRLADPQREPWFRDMTLLNLARYQAELRLFTEAERSWAAVEPFAENTHELVRHGIRGYIDLQRGNLGPAIDRLRECAEGLLTAGHATGAYYQLLLASALLADGRSAEARSVSLAAAQFFEPVQVPTVAMAASELAAAASRRMVTAAEIATLIKAIEAVPETRDRLFPVNRPG